MTWHISDICYDVNLGLQPQGQPIQQLLKCMVSILNCAIENWLFLLQNTQHILTIPCVNWTAAGFNQQYWTAAIPVSISLSCNGYSIVINFYLLNSSNIGKDECWITMHISCFQPEAILTRQIQYWEIFKAPFHHSDRRCHSAKTSIWQAVIFQEKPS